MSPLVLRRLLLFFLLTAASHGDHISDTYDPRMCLQQSSYPCGEHVDVRYPFYLNNETEDTGGADDSYCGYPGMAIVCENKTAILQLSDYNYTVREINYEKNTITLADADTLEDGSSCPRVWHNVTMTTASWLNISGSANENLYFFLGCALPPPGPLSNMYHINCSKFGGGHEPSFVLPQADLPTGENWHPECNEVWAVPVLKEELLKPINYSGFRNGGYGGLLKQGFQLTWDLNEVTCKECELSKGQCSYSKSGGFFGCLCSGERVLDQYCRSGHTSLQKKIIIYTISAASGVILLSLLLFACALYAKKSHGLLSQKRGLKNTLTIQSFLQKHGTPHPKRYAYSEVKRMTKSFAHKLGQGGFGTVYKGNLQDGRQIAVKMLKYPKDDGHEFMNEVASISKTSHVNVVTLLGYCLQGSKRALIYEYMPNGSLERFAFGNNSNGENSLTWKKLFDIVIGIARGLEYLHRGCNTRIVHFDIKPHNILLDQNFCPKISDFGMAKLCMTKESIISIDGARGTIGYIAPEVYSKRFGVVSSKSDVYSYGMMILEIVGARKKINVCTNSSSEYFPQWIYEHFEQYCADACEISVATGGLVRKMITVGLWCIQLLPSNRPSISRVVEMLESSSNDLHIPPQSLLIS